MHLRKEVTLLQSRAEKSLRNRVAPDILHRLVSEPNVVTECEVNEQQVSDRGQGEVLLDSQLSVPYHAPG